MAQESRFSVGRLRVGDEVGVRSRFAVPHLYLYRVDRVLARVVVLSDGSRFSRKTGRQVHIKNLRRDWHRELIDAEEARKHLVQAQLQRSIERASERLQGRLEELVSRCGTAHRWQPQELAAGLRRIATDLVG